MTDNAPNPVGAESPALKVDPETLVLRSRPPHAIRFKRGAVVSLVAIAAALLVGTAWFALEPRALHLISQEDARGADKAVPSDAINGLPSTYAGVPKLGPPLPGDLEKPILDRQRELASLPPAATGQGAVAEARERQAEELKAARQSGLLVQRAGSEQLAAPVGSPAATSTVSTDPTRPALDLDPNGQSRKADFVRTADKEGDANSGQLVAAASPYMLSAGSVISASLITGLRSDLPGLVTAQVTERVYDSATGRILLVPQGARLIGAYDSVIAFGQRTALIVWQRIVFPDGSSIRLDNAPATDPSGYAGLSDKVDFHTWALLKGVVLSTMLGVGAELQFNGEDDLVQALRQSSQQSVSRAGDQLTARTLQVQPTITIRPGAPVRLLVHRDLILKPWEEN